MINKPVMQCEVMVTFVGRKEKTLQLVATQEAMEDFREYFYNIDHTGGESYRVNDDPRYDFDAVINYIESWETA